MPGCERDLAPSPPQSKLVLCTSRVIFLRAGMLLRLLVFSLGKRRLIRVDARRLDWDGLQGAFLANIEIFARKATPQTAQAK